MLLCLQLPGSGKCLLRYPIAPMDFYTLIVFLFSTGCAVKQVPYMAVEKGKSETLTCSQLATSHVNMYWYKQGREKDTRLQLVVYSVEGSGGGVEKEFEGHFSSSGTKNSALSLQLQRARLEDSGTYFCAKQDHTVRQLQRKPDTNLRIIDLTQVQPERPFRSRGSPSGSPFPGARNEHGA
ncbi:hypothetical protein lerEdw1_009042 [Lerista edwardsae]|nr:hypothetical protein lerEdw1_009042 [Lerista edwardsae]